MSEEKTTQKTPIFKKWWFWVIIAVIIICIGAAGASNNKEPKKVGDNGDSSEQQEENKTFKVGDVISIDNREMTIKEVERNYQPKYLKAGDGKEYVLIRVELTNTSDDKISWMSTEWKMEDGNGAIESSAIGANDESDILNYGDLAAGGKKTGSIVFEVPKDDKNLKVHYKPSLFGGSEAIIEL